MSASHPRRWTSATADRSTYALFHQIALASLALDRAFGASAGRGDLVHDALQALEAFDLLERSAPSVVPREVRRRVRVAADCLRADRLELARAELGRAGGELERWGRTSEVLPHHGDTEDHRELR